MHKETSFIVLLALLFFFCSLPVQAQRSIADYLGGSNTNEIGRTDATSTIGTAEPDQLFSSSVSEKFYEIAYGLANSEDVSPSHLEQAIVFLNAAAKLDNNNRGVHTLLIKLACQATEQDHSTLVYNLLINYINESADVEVAKKAILYLLQRLDISEQRERFLEQMLAIADGKNNVISSELYTLLGLLEAEKTDFEAAESHLIQAYKSNKYNKLAFAKLAEIRPERIGPEIYLERLRLELRENPSNINVVLRFAQQLERLQLYETAAAVYEYCADLFSYLYPSNPLPARIYLPWAISCYNSERGQTRCLQIAHSIQQKGRFDLRLEAIAGKAAVKLGNGQLATQIFQAAEKKAQQLLIQTPQTPMSGTSTDLTDRRLSQNPSDVLYSNDSQQVSMKELAWFYSFVLPFPDKAVHWANKAYSAEPNSPETRAFLAYALLMKNQIEWARPVIGSHKRNQIADLALAQIQLSDGHRDSAIETLNIVIAKDPSSFAAERAKEILDQQGAEYIPPVDPNIVLTTLESVYGRTLIPIFTRPDKAISGELNIQGDEFPYGSEINGTVELMNQSFEPLVIKDGAMFEGNIRIDAEISGDLNTRIQNVASIKFRSALLIEPNRSISIPVRLMLGEFRHILLTCPQASLDIEFILYLDPVTDDRGQLMNRLTYIEPARVRIKRPGIKLTGKYLRDRFNLISKSFVGQKIKTAQLFTGLLREQHAMLNRKPLYRFMYADWMEPLLRSALLHESGLLRNFADGEWIVKVHTMAEMLSLQLDYELIDAVAKNLNNTNWPVRMMAVYLLAKAPDGNFDKVVDWTAKNDSNGLVRNMAIALSMSASEQQWQP
jgi:hypothetical protein